MATPTLEAITSTAEWGGLTPAQKDTVLGNWRQSVISEMPAENQGDALNLLDNRLSEIRLGYRPETNPKTKQAVSEEFPELGYPKGAPSFEKPMVPEVESGLLQSTAASTASATLGATSAIAASAEKPALIESPDYPGFPLPEGPGRGMEDMARWEDAKQRFGQSFAFLEGLQGDPSADPAEAQKAQEARASAYKELLALGEMKPAQAEQGITSPEALREMGQSAWDLYNAKREAKNTGAEIGRGLGFFFSAVPLAFGAGPAGIPLGALQGAATAYEDTRAATEEDLRKRGATDEVAIKAAADEAGSEAAIKTGPALAAYFGAGKLAAGFAAKVVGKNASAIEKALSGFAGAEVANIGTSSVLRAIEGEDWKPTIESLTADTLFAVAHGLGEYQKASTVAQARAREELFRRDFTKEQIEEPPVPKAETPADILTTEPKPPSSETKVGEVAQPSTEERVAPPAERVKESAPELQSLRDELAFERESFGETERSAELSARISELEGSTPREEAATVTPKPEVGTIGEAQRAAQLDIHRSRLEREAAKMGAADPELAASQTITDVLASGGNEKVLSSRLKQVVSDMRSKETAEKRGGDEPKESVEEMAETGKEATAETATPREETARRELADAMAEEIAKLPEQDAAIVVGMSEGQSLASIAERLGIKPRAAQRKWEKAQKTLASRLKRFQGQGGFLLINPASDRFGGGAARPQPVTLQQIMVEPYALGNLRRKSLQLFLGKHGAWPAEMRRILRDRGYEEQAIRKNFSQLSRDISGALDALPAADRAANEQLVSNALEGTGPMHAIANDQLREATRRARIALDNVSEAIVDEGAVPHGLGNTIISNVGSWMKRYYAAFDPEANWNLDTLRERASNGDADIQRRLSEAENFIMMDLRRRGLPHAPDNVDAVMRSLTDRTELERFIGTGVNQNVSSYLQRQNIPREIRALMGEERNPVLRVEQSGGFLAQAVTKHRMQQDLRRMGLMSGVFSLSQQGRWSQPVPAPDPGRNPWRGLYTTPEFAKAMNESRLYSDDVATATGKVHELWRRFVGETKFNLVAANPRSTVVNAMGGLFQSIANGTLIPIPGVGAPMGRSMRDAFNAVWRGDGTIDPTAADAAWKMRIREIHNQLVAGGILDSNVTVRDFEASVADGVSSVITPESGADRAVGALRGAVTGYASTKAATGSRTAGAIGAAVGAVGGAAVGSKRITEIQRKVGRELIGKPDAFWKAWNWLDNYATQVRAGTPLQEAARIASERTGNTMPTYERIPEGLRRIAAMVPGANIFFQFTWELYRNNYNNLRYAIQDMRSDNPTLQAAGARRFMGAALITGIMAGAYSWQRSSHDWTEEKDAAFRRSFAPPWDRNGVLLPVKTDGTKISYVNGKYLIPQQTFAELAQAASEGKDPEDGFKRFAGAVIDDFYRSNAALDPLTEAMTNRRAETGKPITTKEGFEGQRERFEYLMSKALTPGVATEAGKIRQAVSKEDAGYGRTYSLQERLQGMMGLRVNTYDVKQQLTFRLSDLDRKWNEASKNANTELRKIASMKEGNPSEYQNRKAEIDAYEKKQKATLRRAALQIYSDAMAVGLEPKDIGQVMNNPRATLARQLRLLGKARELRAKGKTGEITEADLPE